MTGLTPAQAERLRQSGYFDAAWYLARHGDVARGGVSPFDHFCRIGAGLGRDPGPMFSGRAYLAANPDVAAAGLSPLLHALSAGLDEGRPLRPRLAQSEAGRLRGLLEGGGLTDGPLAGLRALADGGAVADDAAQAAEVLALWLLRYAPDAAEGRFRLKQRLDFGDPEAALRLSPLAVIAAARAADAGAETLLAAAPWSPDLELAATWCDADVDARLLRLSALFDRLGAGLLSTAPDGPSGFDRLAGATPRAADGSAPRVSVLVAAHDCAATIGTALRSLQAQTMTAWEAIVVDDASRDDTADRVAVLAAGDPRIRLLRLSENRGAYAARNAALAEARGTFATLLDADDWAHPLRLERQLAALTRGAGDVGCMGLQARLLPDMRVSRWTGTGALLHEDTSSLFLPVSVLRDALGGWHEWRISADAELLRRARGMFGSRSINLLSGAPTGFQRDGDGNATADPATGMGWFYFGARREAYEAQLHSHARAASLTRHADTVIPVPRILSTVSGNRGEFRKNRVYAGRFDRMDEGLQRLLDWLDDDAAAGRTAGLVALHGMDSATVSLHPALRARVNGGLVSVLVFGEQVQCDLFRRLPDQHVTEPQRYLPHVRAPDGLVLWPGLAPDGPRAEA